MYATSLATLTPITPRYAVGVITMNRPSAGVLLKCLNWLGNSEAKQADRQEDSNDVAARCSQLIVSAHVSQYAADTPELQAGIDNIPEELGPPERVLADSGYVDRKALKRIENARDRPVCERKKQSCAHTLSLRLSP